MRGLLVFSCRAFPPDHRARHSDEVVDTALLAADGSAWRAGREAFSLVVAGYRQRLRAESGRSVRDGAALLAGVLALVNFAVALAGITVGVPHAAAASILLAVCRTGRAPSRTSSTGGGSRSPSPLPASFSAWRSATARLAVGAALANLGLVGYDARFLADGIPVRRPWPPRRLHLCAGRRASPPVGSGSQRRPCSRSRRPRRRCAGSRSVACRSSSSSLWLLVVLSRETWGAFFFLRWPLAALVLLAVAFGAVAPRLAVLAFGVTLAAIPSVLGYLTAPNLHHDPVVIGAVAAGLAVGVLLPLAQLARRRLT